MPHSRWIVADRGAGPQREVHLQLLRPLVADQLANTRFLIGREAAAIAHFLATFLGLQRGHAARLVEVDGCSNGGPAQIGQRHDLHHAITLFVQADDLLASLVQLDQSLAAGIMFAHPIEILCFAEIVQISTCRINSMRAQAPATRVPVAYCHSPESPR